MFTQVDKVERGSERIHFRHTSFVLKNKWQVSTSQKFWTPALGQTLLEKASTSFLRSGTAPPSVYLSGHWHHSHDKIDQASPLHYCMLKVIKIGWWEGLGAWCQLPGLLFSWNMSLRHRVPSPLCPAVACKEICHGDCSTVYQLYSPSSSFCGII